jgi:DNA-binding MurR/RpiR family transcriptional regulator
MRTVILFFYFLDSQENLQYIASMPLKNVVAQQDHTLSDSDRQVIRELLSNPAVTAFLSAAEVAERVGIHESTVVRLAKKLGYRGYKELRHDLLDETAPADRVRKRLGGTTELAVLVDQEMGTLQSLVNSLPQQSIDDAARLLIQARKIFLFGRGHSTALLEYMNKRLRRSGFETVVLESHGRELAERVLTMNDQDVLLSFIFRLRTPGAPSLLKHTSRVGAHHILVSDMNGLMIRPQPGILLAASRGADDQFLTLTVPMVICNALILTIARLDQGRSVQQLETLNDLIRLFETEDMD